MGKVKQKNIIISCYEQQPFHVELISSKVAAMNKQMFESTYVAREREESLLSCTRCISAYTQWYLFFPRSRHQCIYQLSKTKKMDKWSCILILLLYHKMTIMVIFWRRSIVFEPVSFNCQNVIFSFYRLMICVYYYMYHI